jgi:hypothetical protein
MAELAAFVGALHVLFLHPCHRHHPLFTTL